LLRAATRRILAALSKTDDPFEASALALALRPLLERLTEPDAAAAARPAASKLCAVLAKAAQAAGPPDLTSGTRAVLAESVGALAAFMPAEEGAAVAKSLLGLQGSDRGRFLNGAGPATLDGAARSGDPSGLCAFSSLAGPLAERLRPEEAARGAREICDALARGSDDRTERTRLVNASIALTARLDDEQLVELLKEPTCVEEVRRVALDALAYRLGPPAADAPGVGLAAGAAAAEVRYPGGRRPFADLWEAVDWLRERRPELNPSGPLREAGR
jgi:hypothetical protein